MIKIDLENTFTPIDIADDLLSMSFNSPIGIDKNILIKIVISSLGDPLLPNVFNLAFGPQKPMEK